MPPYPRPARRARRPDRGLPGPSGVLRLGHHRRRHRGLQSGDRRAAALASQADADAPLSGAVFKVERGAAGERIAFARLWDGRVDVRERLAVHGEERRVTRIELFDDGAAKPVDTLPAGRIGKLWGLGDIRIGDPLGEPRHGPDAPVRPRRRWRPWSARCVRSDKGRLFAALAQLAEQDPLIALRQDDLRGEIAVSLYGEVQKEVIRDTLAADFRRGGRVRRDHADLHRAACRRRRRRSGSRPTRSWPAWACALSRARRAQGSSSSWRWTSARMPAAFFKAVEDAVRETLRQGLNGWDIPDAVRGDDPRHPLPPFGHQHSGRSPAPDAAGPDAGGEARRDRGLRADRPLHPHRPGTLRWPPCCPNSPSSRRRCSGQASEGRMAVIEGEIAVRQRARPAASGCPASPRAKACWRPPSAATGPAKGDPPVRARTDANPLDKKEYLQNLARRL